ncbi:hypothetical protein ACFLXQ_04885 [Chloroflexota bacterium]
MLPVMQRTLTPTMPSPAPGRVPASGQSRCSNHSFTIVMKKLLVCLANSRKYTHRCIAGIELVKTPRSYRIVKKNGHPIWIRPVSQSEYGGISSLLVNHINLLDIVEVNIVAPHPQGYQSENMLFDNQHLAVVGKVDQDETIIGRLLGVNRPALFGNKSKTVSAENINQLDHSLIFIKPAKVQVHQTTTSTGNPQLRTSFTYAGSAYNLPVTDIEFTHQFSKDPMILQSCTQVYFTISLGIEFNGWHYKLIAGVVYF